MGSTPAQPMTWLMYALMTVASWGVYGVFLHMGRTGMADKVNGSFKAFLLVGVAYFLTAVLAPLCILWMRGADWSYPLPGVGWSLVAGIMGAFGAFFVLVAFASKGTPSVVMTIVFAGAPVVNAIVATMLHPPENGLAGIPWQFVAGILLAVAGGGLVTLYNPGAAVPHAPAKAAHTAPVQPTQPITQTS